MIAQWNSSLFFITVAQVRFPATADFSLADHALPTRPEPAWQKMAQSPLNETTPCGQRGGRLKVQPWIDDG